MELRQGGAQFGRMIGRNLPRPHPGQERHDGGGTAAKPAQGLAVTAADRRRTRDTGFGQMVHEAEEKRQIISIHPFFIEGQDEVTVGGGEGEIGILDSFGDAFVGQHLADVVFGGESDQFLVADFSINGHGVPLPGSPGMSNGTADGLARPMTPLGKVMVKSILTLHCPDEPVI